jgi:hypothetical protein
MRVRRSVPRPGSGQLLRARASTAIACTAMGWHASRIMSGTSRGNSPRPKIRVLIRHSKTDLEGQGQEIAIQHSSRLRPVQAVRARPAEYAGHTLRGLQVDGGSRHMSVDTLRGYVRLTDLMRERLSCSRVAPRSWSCCKPRVTGFASPLIERTVSSAVQNNGRPHSERLAPRHHQARGILTPRSPARVVGQPPGSSRASQSGAP